MAQSKTEDLGEDFSYILRMADTDIDGLKPLATALTAVRESVQEPLIKSAVILDLAPLNLLDIYLLKTKKNSV